MTIISGQPQEVTRFTAPVNVNYDIAQKHKCSYVL